MHRIALATLLVAAPALAHADEAAPFTLAQPGLAAAPVDMTAGADSAAPITKASSQFRATGGWGGFYGGVQLGLGDADLNRGGGDDTGALGGVHAGYNHDFGTFIAGVEGSISLADIDFDNGAGGEVDTLGRLGLRLGKAYGDVMVYGTGGAAFVDGDYGGRDDDDLGWFLGAGVDYRVNDRWIAGLAANYHEFSGFGGPGRDLEFVTIEARMSMRF